jgi:hypothetical protein
MYGSLTFCLQYGTVFAVILIRLYALRSYVYTLRVASFGVHFTVSCMQYQYNFSVAPAGPLSSAVFCFQDMSSPWSLRAALD